MAVVVMVTGGAVVELCKNKKKMDNSHLNLSENTNS